MHSGLEKKSSNTDFLEQIKSYTRHWIWFAFSALACLVLARVYLRYTVPEFGASAKIQIVESKSANSELSVLQDLNVFGGGNTDIKDEIEILGSRSNFAEVVDNLNLNINFSVIGSVRSSDLYGTDFPFTVNFLAPDSVINTSRYSFYINPLSETQFEFREEEDGPAKRIAFGASISTVIGELVLVPNDDMIEFFEDKVIRISVNPIFDTADFYRSKTNISTPDKFSKILNLGLTDPIKQRGIDVLNELDPCR